MDSTTKTTSFQQKLKNLPAEILAQPRFFKDTGVLQLGDGATHDCGDAFI